MSEDASGPSQIPKEILSIPVPDNKIPPTAIFEKKSPQLLAAEMQAVGGLHFIEGWMKDSKTLTDRYTQMRTEVKELLEKGVDNVTLQTKLDQMYEEGKASGMYKPTDGKDGQDLIKSRIEEARKYSSSDDEAEKIAKEQLDNYGYLDNLRSQRRREEEDFKNALGKVVEKKPLDTKLEDEALAKLRERVIDLGEMTPEQYQSLKNEFVGGNFLFHGARTKELVKVLETGELLNFKAVYEREQEVAQKEGREREFLSRNSGYEGISWSMNSIDALPGDRYHLAGFLASPARVLQEDQQFAVPSRPAPFEVIQVSGEIDGNRFYRNKTQEELLVYVGLMGGANSVLGNFLDHASVLRSQANGEEPTFAEDTLNKFLEKHSDDEIKNIASSQYKAKEDGTIEFNEDLVQQNGDPLPIAIVWAQALIDTGRVNRLEHFSDVKTVREFVQRITTENLDTLYEELRIDRRSYFEQSEKDEEKTNEISVNVEDMYFVVPSKDLDDWLRVIARCDKQPKGILAYDARKVKLENWASAHEGDNKALEDQIRQGISANQEGWIDWEKQILGKHLSSDDYAGSQKQVLKESALRNRKTIRKDSQGNFVFA